MPHRQIPRTCVVCGKDFTCRSDLKTKTCSKGCTSVLLSQTLTKHNPILCATCGKLFKPVGAKSKYCSRECFILAAKPAPYICDYCGKEVQKGKRSRNLKHFCGLSCKQAFDKISRKGSAAQNYIDGRTPYLQLKVDGKGTTVHRHIMERYLGRNLSFNEVVHHINGNKKDNRINNLVVMDRDDHVKMHNPRGW